MAAWPRSVAVLCLLAAGAVPAAAAAAPPRALYAFGRFRDYRVMVYAREDAHPATGSAPGLDVTVGFARRDGRSSQAYEVLPRGAARLAAGGGLRAAAVDVGLGGLGSVSLRFHSRGGVRATVPAGCDGASARTRRGTVSGLVELHLGGRYFGTVRLRRLRAVLSADASRYDCAVAPDVDAAALGVGATAAAPDYLTELAVPRLGPAPGFAVDRRDADAVVTETAARQRASSSAVVKGVIVAVAPARCCVVPADLASARVTAEGPFLSGAAAFVADPPGPGDFVATVGFPFATRAGTTTGDLAARWDLYGRTPLSGDGGPAVLRRTTITPG